MPVEQSEVPMTAFLVIAKHDTEKDVPVLHMLAFGDDEGEAIQMAKYSIWPPMPPGMGQNTAGPSYNQFTVKRVWESQPLPGKRLFLL